MPCGFPSSGFHGKGQNSDECQALAEPQRRGRPVVRNAAAGCRFAWASAFRVFYKSDVLLIQLGPVWWRNKSSIISKCLIDAFSLSHPCAKPRVQKSRNAEPCITSSEISRPSPRHSFNRCFFSLRPSGVYLGHPLAMMSRANTSVDRAYLRSFSMRSTWVMIMRRQQYRLRPSSSIASLESH